MEVCRECAETVTPVRRNGLKSRARILWTVRHASVRGQTPYRTVTNLRQLLRRRLRVGRPAVGAGACG